MCTMPLRMTTTDGVEIFAFISRYDTGQWPNSLGNFTQSDTSCGSLHSVMDKFLDPSLTYTY